MTRTAIKLLVIGVLCIYPVAIYFADGYLTTRQLSVGLLLLLAARVLVAAWINAAKRRLNITLMVRLLAAALLLLLWVPDINLVYLRLYPMVLNLLAFGLFFGSLFTSMPLVERMARFVHTDLPAQAIVYTRRVTWIWSVVLLLNVLISLYTALGTTFAIWSAYNGVVVYVLFGSLLLGEYLLRRQLRRKWAAA